MPLATPLPTRRDSTDDDDIVWGGAAIGEVINRSSPQTYHLLEAGILPARKINGRWAASKRRLRAFVLGPPAEGLAP